MEIIPLPEFKHTLQYMAGLYQIAALRDVMRGLGFQNAIKVPPEERGNVLAAIRKEGEAVRLRNSYKECAEKLTDALDFTPTPKDEELKKAIRLALHIAESKK